MRVLRGSPVRTRLALLLLVASPLFASTYEDPAGKFRFDLPSGWTARVKGQLPGETPLHFAKGDFSCDLTVVASNEEDSLEDALAEVLPNLREQGDVAQSEARVDDLPAARLELTPSDDGRDLAIVLVVKGTAGRLTVELAAPRDAYRRDRARFDEVLAGFHVGGAKEAAAGYAPDFEVRDDGTTLVAGNPPLTWRVVSGCLGAVEFAWDIELTEHEKAGLASSVLDVFRAGTDAEKQALVDLSERAWGARDVPPDGASLAQKELRDRATAGEGAFAKAVSDLTTFVIRVDGHPSTHEVGALIEWAALATPEVQGRKPEFTLQEEHRWIDGAIALAASPDRRIDVEWMAVRAAWSAASAADRNAFRDRLVTALGGGEAAQKALSEAADVGALLDALREAARPLLSTLTPAPNFADPMENRGIRYRY